MDVQVVKDMAKKMRRKILDISYSCNLSVHMGGALSIVDIMATLYGSVLRYDTKMASWEDRDRFILSKGHGALGYYSALLEAGIISEEVFTTFPADLSDATNRKVPTGNSRLSKHLIMASPTAPVAPTITIFLVSIFINY